jgi:ABC-type lipoprotein release transport system permease subunit
VGATDALTYVVVAGSLFAIATVATLGPARRATSLSPLQALRNE